MMTAITEVFEPPLRRASLDSPVLVLNVGYEPLATIPLQRAICLLIGEKAEVVEEDLTLAIRSPSVSFWVPVVIRLLRYVRIPRRVHGRAGRRLVFARDGFECAYCSRKGDLTIDHVKPTSRGGTNEWSNVVACCRQCNQHKDNRLPEEAGMALRVKPRRPTALELICGGRKNIPAAWQTYLATN